MSRVHDVTMAELNEDLRTVSACVRNCMAPHGSKTACVSLRVSGHWSETRMYIVHLFVVPDPDG